MYPELAMHDIIVISGHALFEDVKVGDIIVFDRPKDHDKVIVLRVVAVVDDDPLTLRTKGDNNQNSMVGTNYPITEEEYKGTVIHVIPQVGYITKILQPPINYIIIAVIIGIMIIRQIYRKDKKNLIDQAKAESSISDYNDFPVGIFSERDYARKIILKGKNSKDTLFNEVMTKELITVTRDY